MEKQSGKVGTIETWLKKHTLVYTAATRHPFIHRIRDGTVDPSSIKRWLGQDYGFVRVFVPFVANVLVKAWKESDDGSDMEVILGGMAYLNDELAWCKEEALKWEVSLSDTVRHSVNLRHCRFLESLMSQEIDYTVAITAFWAIEAVYHESFAHCLEEDSKTPDELKGTCERWGSDAFGQYCHSLREIVDRRLEKAPADVVSKAEVILLHVLEHEVEFWNISRGKA
ncbi:hypothetical protein NMG60_11032957 [Bertholletia excelsa]